MSSKVIPFGKSETDMALIEVWNGTPSSSAAQLILSTFNADYIINSNYDFIYVHVNLRANSTSEDYVASSWIPMSKLKSSANTNFTENLLYENIGSYWVRLYFYGKKYNDTSLSGKVKIQASSNVSESHLEIYGIKF